MKFDLKHVLKAKNLDLIGWAGGYMLVQFKGRPTRYVFGPNISEAEFDKILVNPYPDRLFTTNIRNRFKCHKIEDR